jgi:cytochrome c oxidase subunit 2
MIARRSARLGVALLAIVSVGGCIPEAVTVEGERISDLYLLFMAAAAVVFAIVVGLIGWSIVRYRHAEPNELPPQTRAHFKLELAWWALPTLVVVVLVFSTIGVLGFVNKEPGHEALRVEVDAFQWGWQFEFPDAGVRVAGTAIDPPRIRLPLDRQITFVLTSEDVVHSFYVPRFLIKRDHVPGFPNELTVTITEEGTYAGRCGEFCGLLHEAMRFEIDAVSTADFERWLGEQGTGG